VSTCREHHQFFLIVMAVSVLLVISFMASTAYVLVQNTTNDHRCEAIHGPSWHWKNKDLCQPPPVHTPGLM
jgi:hypothetical protein